MSRNLLHVSKIEEFKSWLDQNGIAHRPGRGDWQELQVQARPPDWYCVFNRLHRSGEAGLQKEHYTVDCRLEPLVHRFIRDRRAAQSIALDKPGPVA